MKTSFQPEGNYYDKYHSANPIVKWMMRKFFNDFGSLLQQVGDIEDILEAGCGEGEVCDFLWSYYEKSCRIEAFDISERVVQKAREKNPEIEFSVGNIYDLSARGGGTALSYVLRY